MPLLRYFWTSRCYLECIVFTIVFAPLANLPLGDSIVLMLLLPHFARWRRKPRNGLSIYTVYEYPDRIAT